MRHHAQGCQLALWQLDDSMLSHESCKVYNHGSIECYYEDGLIGGIMAVSSVGESQIQVSIRVSYEALDDFLVALNADISGMRDTLARLDAQWRWMLSQISGVMADSFAWSAGRWLVDMRSQIDVLAEVRACLIRYVDDVQEIDSDAINGLFRIE